MSMSDMLMFNFNHNFMFQIISLVQLVFQGKKKGLEASEKIIFYQNSQIILKFLSSAG